MITINFLPWRTLLRKKQQRLLLRRIKSCVLVGLVLGFGWHYFLSRYYTRINEANRKLLSPYTSISRMEATWQHLITYEHQVATRGKWSQRLRQQQSQFWELLLELERSKPPSVYLTGLTQNTAGISILGQALVLNGLIQFLEKLQKQGHWTVNLQKMHRVGAALYEFEIILAQT